MPSVDNLTQSGASEVPEQLQAAEFTALRSEILQAQQTRGVILALAFTTLGVTATLGTGDAADSGSVAVTAAVLSTFSLLVVGAALHFTAILTLRIDVIATYILRYIETPYGGMWETRWREALRRPAPKQAWIHPPMATSKGYAVYYFLLALGGAGEFWVTSGGAQPWLFAFPLLPFTVTLALCHDLYTKRRAAWPDPMAGETFAPPALQEGADAHTPGRALAE
jgi:hypothetical protein